MNEPRIIVALDFERPEKAVQLAQSLDPAQCRLKVGKELFTRGGPVVVERLQQQGFEIFLDLKFHDIPNTVAKAVRAAAELGVWMINVHACGGPRMLEAARQALAGVSHPPRLIAVTVLTSMGSAELEAIGVRDTIDEQVDRLAALAHEAGLDGVVCSAREARRLKARFGPAFQLITPGIRPAWAAANDQTRIVTPADALSDGADYLVIGRPITQAKDPLEALARIQQEIETARQPA